MKRQRNNLVPPPSFTSLQRSLGKSNYTRGKHPVKQAINNWILNLACRELLPSFPSSTNQRFALLLETGAAQTIDTILSKSAELGITDTTIVVPNPSQDVCSPQLSASHPNVLTVPTTSHELIRLLCESSTSTSSSTPPPLLKELLSRG